MRIKAVWKQNRTLRGLERKCFAFTGTDLMVGLAIASILAAIGIVPITVVRKQARLALCSENLHQISGAVLAQSNDHHKTLPGAVPGTPGDLWWWYKEQIKPYLGDPATNSHLFACPSDRGYSDPKPFHQTARFDYGSYVYNGVTMPGGTQILQGGNWARLPILGAPCSLWSGLPTLLFPGTIAKLEFEMLHFIPMPRV